MLLKPNKTSETAAKDLKSEAADNDSGFEEDIDDKQEYSQKNDALFRKSKQHIINSIRADEYAAGPFQEYLARAFNKASHKLCFTKNGSIES